MSAFAGTGREAGPDRVAILTGEDLRCLQGAVESAVALLACRDACTAIPWQLDERTEDGVLALDHGPGVLFDDPRGVVDANDEILWMAEDAGRRGRPGEIPAGAPCRVEIRLQTAEAAEPRWVYAVVLPGSAPRSPRSYVQYDAERDTLVGERVSLGFGGPTPQYLAVHAPGGADGPNLLDRLKVRVSARFLGVIPVHRDEADLTTEFVGWRAGPIRVVRRQRQWARVGFGLRSPTFALDAFFYRDHSELPVRLRLNFPPTYFFRGVEVRAGLDFRDLRGWRFLAPGMRAPVEVGRVSAVDLQRIHGVEGNWFALSGDDVTLVQRLVVGPSFSSVTRSVLYAEGTDDRGPESVRGEMPAAGFALTRWEDVGSGHHWFSPVSYALPPDGDVERFLRESEAPLSVESAELP